MEPELSKKKLSQKVFDCCFQNKFVSKCSVIFANVSTRPKIASVLPSKFIGPP